MFDGAGWNYPIRINEKTGHIQKTELKEDIRQSILILLSTTPGERVFHPNFGCNLQKFAFEPITYEFLRRVQEEVYRAIRRFEKRIYNLEVVVERVGEEGNSLVFVIQYDIINLAEKDQIAYAYHMMGA